MWSLDRSRILARQELGKLGERWAHAQAVGQLAEELLCVGLIDDDLASAAWLHDIGYAPRVAETGFHPIDGARYLERLGAPDIIVALVASHTGARWEAEERGLLDEWSRLPTPPEDALDTLTLIDLVTGPAGDAVEPSSRIEEVLRRYEPVEPTHRAVRASREALQHSANSARERLGLPDEWPAVPVERVLQA